jgi:hypothetical protein
MNEPHNNHYVLRLSFIKIVFISSTEFRKDFWDALDFEIDHFNSTYSELNLKERLQQFKGIQKFNKFLSNFNLESPKVIYLGLWFTNY